MSVDSVSVSILSFDLGSANRTALQAMDESFPKRPALFFDFVLPSRSKDLFSNVWIADPHLPQLQRLASCRNNYYAPMDWAKTAGCTVVLRHLAFRAAQPRLTVAAKCRWN